MSMVKLKDEYIGGCNKIIHCEGAIESFEEATAGLGDKQRSRFAHNLNLQIQRLADEGRHSLSSNNFPEEGKLPNKPGKPKRKFRAFKRIPLRGYCWKSDLHQNTYFISHYRYKNYTKLANKDVERIGHNWNKIENNEPHD